MLQIPSTSIVNKIGYKKSIILGNILVTTSIIALVFANNLNYIIFSQFLSAFGFALKGLSESNLLYDSIPRSKKRNDLFSKIDGKSSALHYYIDAVSATITGFLFVFNGYLPILICIIFCVIATILSTKFIDVSRENAENKSNSIKNNLLNLKEAFKFIFKSNRLRALIIFNACLSAILAVLISLRSSILVDINLPSQYFGLIFAALGIISGIASQNSAWFHNKYKNKTLTVFSITLTISMIVIGMCVIFNLHFGLCLEFILLMFVIQYLIKGPFYTLIKRYLNSFSTSSMRTNISSASDLVYSVFRSIICFISSALLSVTTTSYVFVILGCIFTVFFIFLLDYMKHTVGLKPEQYSKKEIEFTPLH